MRCTGRGTRGSSSLVASHSSCGEEEDITNNEIVALVTVGIGYTTPQIDISFLFLYIWKGLISLFCVLLCVLHHGCGHPITGTQNHGWF
ncbi:hypothetical protein F2P79_001066 [Pimephales promelas]|nr:hypothetical protein F2P79_001066 [Pimephales promelas]